MSSMRTGYGTLCTPWHCDPCPAPSPPAAVAAAAAVVAAADGGDGTAAAGATLSVEGMPEGLSKMEQMKVRISRDLYMACASSAQNHDRGIH